MPLPSAKALRLAPSPAASAAAVSATVPIARRITCLVMQYLLSLPRWMKSARQPGNRPPRCSDVALLRRFLVARIDERVAQDRREQDDALDQVLRRVRDVEVRHAVHDRPDQERADDDVADAATAAREADAAEHDDQDHVVDH